MPLKDCSDIKPITLIQCLHYSQILRSSRQHNQSAEAIEYKKGSESPCTSVWLLAPEFVDKIPKSVVTYTRNLLVTYTTYHIDVQAGLWTDKFSQSQHTHHPGFAVSHGEIFILEKSHREMFSLHQGQGMKNCGTLTYMV